MIVSAACALEHPAAQAPLKKELKKYIKEK